MWSLFYEISGWNCSNSVSLVRAILSDILVRTKQFLGSASHILSLRICHYCFRKVPMICESISFIFKWMIAFEIGEKVFETWIFTIREHTSFKLCKISCLLRQSASLGSCIPDSQMLGFSSVEKANQWTRLPGFHHRIVPSSATTVILPGHVNSISHWHRKQKPGTYLIFVFVHCAKLSHVLQC